MDSDRVKSTRHDSTTADRLLWVYLDCISGIGLVGSEYSVGSVMV